MMVVTEPAAGEHVSHRHCRFAGRAAPGVEIVAAGRYPVTVADDGTWETVLILNPGGNVAVFSAVDESGNEVEARVPVYYDPPVELRIDGLGPVDFATPMDEAMAALAELLGPPNDDRVIDRQSLPPELAEDEHGIAVGIGYPAWDYARFVSWETAGLQVMFSDWTGFDGPRFTNMNGWIASDAGDYGARLTTAEGVGPGDGLPALQAAYREALTWYEDPDELTGDWHFSIDSGIPHPQWDHNYFLHGRFDRSPLDRGVEVARFQAGFGFDEC